MKKRMGAALMSVLAVFVFVSILALAILTVYVSTVKQSAYSSTIDQLNYTAMSGLSIVSSYIVNTNDEFILAYERESGGDRSKPVPIPFSQNSYDCVVTITSTYREDNSTGLEKTETVYYLSSIARKDGIESEPVKLEVTQSTVKDLSDSTGEIKVTFEVGKIQ